MDLKSYCILATIHIITSSCFSDPLPLFADVQVFNRNNSEIDNLFSVSAQFGPRLSDDGLYGFIANAEPRNACVPILPPPDLPLTNHSTRPVQWIAVIRRSPASAPDTNANLNYMASSQNTTARPSLSSKLPRPGNSYNFLWNLGHLSDNQPRKRVSLNSGENAGTDCTFAQKVLNAQRAGFSAAIIYNVDSDDLIVMNGGQIGSQVNIPSVFVGATAGEFLVTTYAYNKEPFIVRQTQSANPITTTRSVDLHFKADAASTPSSRRVDKMPEYYARIAEYSSVGLLAYLVPFVILIVTLLSFLLVLVVVKSLQDCRRARRARLRPAHLRKLPVRTFDKEDPECSHYETCAICLDDYQNGDKLRVLPCKHAYHKKCIDPWLLNSRRVCPVCKARVHLSGLPATTTTTSGASTSASAAQRPPAAASAGAPSNEAGASSPDTPGATLEAAAGPAGETSNAIAPSGESAARSSRIANETEADLLASDDDDVGEPEPRAPRSSLALGGAPSTSVSAAPFDERTPLLRASSVPARDPDADAESVYAPPRRVSFLERLLRSARLRSGRVASAGALSVSADPERFSRHSYESALVNSGVPRHASTTADGCSSDDLALPAATTSSSIALVEPTPSPQQPAHRVPISSRLRRLFGGGVRSASELAPAVEETRGANEQPNSGVGQTADATQSPNPLV